MPRVRPLSSPEHAKRTLAHRLTRKADRIRQLSTRFGLRANRVFLVWTEWSGAERGEGDEVVKHRVELLPTPRVSDPAVTYQPRSSGSIPEGSVIVDQISAGAYNFDNLSGLLVPSDYAVSPRGPDFKSETLTPEPVELAPNRRIDFFYEIVEDGRGTPGTGNPPPYRHRFRLFGIPTRKPGSIYFTVVLEQADDELSRHGESKVDDLDVFDEAED